MIIFALLYGAQDIAFGYFFTARFRQDYGLSIVVDATRVANLTLPSYLGWFNQNFLVFDVICLGWEIVAGFADYNFFIMHPKYYLIKPKIFK